MAKLMLGNTKCHIPGTSMFSDKTNFNKFNDMLNLLEAEHQWEFAVTGYKNYKDNEYVYFALEYDCSDEIDTMLHAIGERTQTKWTCEFEHNKQTGEMSFMLHRIYYAPCTGKKFPLTKNFDAEIMMAANITRTAFEADTRINYIKAQNNANEAAITYMDLVDDIKSVFAEYGITITQDEDDTPIVEQLVEYDADLNFKLSDKYKNILGNAEEFTLTVFRNPERHDAIMKIDPDSDSLMTNIIMACTAHEENNDEDRKNSNYRHHLKMPQEFTDECDDYDYDLDLQFCTVEELLDFLRLYATMLQQFISSVHAFKKKYT